jgi:nucleotide-binding universal stress UspA family protein
MAQGGRIRPIVVGVDDSDESATVAAWAAREAVRAGRRLRVVHGFIWPLMRVPLGPSASGPGSGGLRADAERILADAAAAARAAAPTVELETELVTGAPTGVLIGESHQAAYVVVGYRGVRGFAGLLIGSVALQLAQYAASPVVVVRPDSGEGSGHVVVGVDGSDAGGSALRFAAASAAERDAELIVVSAGQDAADPTARRTVDACVAFARAHRPGIEVIGRVVTGHPAGALVEASKDADVLVVGSRGAGGFRGMLLGSVSQTVLHHARCPVAIVRRRLDAVDDPAS